LRSNQSSISVVVPAFNEADNVPQLVGELHAALLPLACNYELIFVDDASTDDTLAVLRRLAMSDGRLRILRHGRNTGQSAALATGLRAARGETIVTLDADLQNDPADIPRLLRALEDCDAVSGVRQRRRDCWSRRVSSRVANAIRNWALGESIADVGCALKAYRRQVLRGIPLFDGMHRFLPTLVRWNGGRIRELPVGHRARCHGTSKYGLGNRIFRVTVDLFGVLWLGRRWIARNDAEEVSTCGTSSSGRSSVFWDRASSSLGW
jgi:dolichol-phosphate mannosyltransferase